MTIARTPWPALLGVLLAALPACGGGVSEGDAGAVGSETASDTLPGAPGTTGLPPENSKNSGNH